MTPRGVTFLVTFFRGEVLDHMASPSRSSRRGPVERKALAQRDSLRSGVDALRKNSRILPERKIA